MNKEELEKEAEEWVKNNNYPYSNCPNIEKKLKQAYLAGAEPREKRIAELEAQIEKMKCCGNCFHFRLDNKGLYPIKVCELTYLNRCKNHDKWEIKENAD